MCVSLVVVTSSFLLPRGVPPFRSFLPSLSLLVVVCVGVGVALDNSLISQTAQSIKNTTRNAAGKEEERKTQLDILPCLKCVVCVCGGSVYVCGVWLFLSVSFVSYSFFLCDSATATSAADREGQPRPTIDGQQHTTINNNKATTHKRNNNTQDARGVYHRCHR